MKGAKNTAVDASGQPKTATSRVSSSAKPVTKETRLPSKPQTTKSPSSTGKPASTKEPAAGSAATRHTVAAQEHANAKGPGGTTASGNHVPAQGRVTTSDTVASGHHVAARRDKITETDKNHIARRTTADGLPPKGSSSTTASKGQKPTRRLGEAHSGQGANEAPSTLLSETQAPASRRVAKGDELPHRPNPQGNPGPSRESPSDRPDPGSHTVPDVATEIPGLKYEASDRVGNLRVFKDPPGKILTETDDEPGREAMPQVEETDNIFIILSHCIHTGLRILENPKGRKALAAGGQQYIDNLRSERLAYDKPAEDMPDWVTAFLRQIREDFPNIYVTKTLQCVISAETERLNWGTDLEEYKPKLAALIYFNGTILDNTIHQAQMVKSAREKSDKTGEDNALKNYNRSLFYLSVTVAHELMHTFIGYLTGYAPVKTPDTMSHPPKVRGESGWWFEGDAFGGGIFMAEDPKDPLGLRQAGTPYLLDRGFICTRVSETFIQNVINDRLLMLLSGGGYGQIKCLESEHSPQPLEKLQEAGFGTTARLRVKIHMSILEARKEKVARVAKGSVRMPVSRLELLRIDKLRKSTIRVKAPLRPERVAS